MKRDAARIRYFLDRKKVTHQHIANECGVSRPSVTLTIKGDKHCRVVLAWLVEKGCPKRALALPEDMRKAA